MNYKLAYNVYWPAERGALYVISLFFLIIKSLYLTCLLRTVTSKVYKNTNFLLINDNDIITVTSNFKIYVELWNLL